MNVCVHTHVRAADFFPRTLHTSLQKIINISTCSYHLLTQLTQNKHFKKTLQKITITKTIYMGYPYPYVNKYIIIINKNFFLHTFHAILPPVPLTSTFFFIHVMCTLFTLFYLREDTRGDCCSTPNENS